MKTKLLFLIALLPIIGFSQERNSKINFKTLDKKEMKTSIFVEMPAPFSSLNNDTQTHGMFSLQQTYKELAKADALQRFSNLESLNAGMRLNTTNETIKIGGLHVNYETLSEEAVALNKVSISPEGNVTQNSNDYIFKSHTKTMIAPLTINKKGLKSSFYLDSNLFINASNDVISSIQVDFDDNKGFIDIPFNTPISVTYPVKGIKEITFKITINGIPTISKAKLNVKYSRNDNMQLRNANQEDIFSTIAPDLSIYPTTDSFAGMAEYEIFLGADGILNKPIIVIDGFDPSDTRDIDAVYDLLTYTDSNNVTQNLGDRIRNEEDFDVIILNFPQYLKLADNTLLNLDSITDTNGDMIIDETDYPVGSVLIDGGADYVERNAMALIELIDFINSEKIGAEENVIIGPSMGGLISRYALTYMEQNNMNHETRLWISFDSPHYGANVPVSLQLLFNYFGYGYGDSDSVKFLIDGFLRSPAARQMLVDHFDAHMNPINSNTEDPVSPSSGLPYTPTGAPGYRDAFQNRMNSVGFPTTTRNVSITNGSGFGAAFQDINGVDVTPGFDLINSNIDTGDVIIFINTRADTFCEFMPYAGVQEKIVDVKIQAQFFIWITQDTFIADAESHSYTDGVDSSPGGLFDIFALADSLGGDPVLTNFLNAMNSGYFSFIPTTSGMALANQQDYYAIPNPNDGTTENQSPFVAWYMPPTNEGHVILTDPNVNFAWNEIVLNTLDTDTFDNNFIKVKQNPFENVLSILSPNTINNATISIVDVTGKVVYSKVQTITNETNIPLKIASGIYILNIETIDGNRLKTKIIKE